MHVLNRTFDAAAGSLSPHCRGKLSSVLAALPLGTDMLIDMALGNVGIRSSEFLTD